jgi:hypothetical protein
MFQTKIWLLLCKKKSTQYNKVLEGNVKANKSCGDHAMENKKEITSSSYYKAYPKNQAKTVSLFFIHSFTFQSY